jgi:DNA-binding transcriptional LysR family regulator
MANATRNVPSLDLLRGFEAAARHLNFTRAADELFITQSAVSRQIKTLEDRLGVSLFVRQARGLQLTSQGQQLFRAVSGALRQVTEVMDSLTRREQTTRVTVTSTLAFCGLWLIPRLGRFHRAHPEVDVRIDANDRVLNLDRERIDMSVRYCMPQMAPKGAVYLFNEELVPVCSPALLQDPSRPLGRPADLRHQVLLELDDPQGPAPWLQWPVWLQQAGVPALKPAGLLVFNYYDQLIRAALTGQGVALGRTALVRELIEDGSLVMPFEVVASTDRAYHAVIAGFARGRSEVARFMEWLVQEAQAHQQPLRNRGTRAAPRARARRARAVVAAKRENT